MVVYYTLQYPLKMGHLSPFIWLFALLLLSCNNSDNAMKDVKTTPTNEPILGTGVISDVIGFNSLRAQYSKTPSRLLSINADTLRFDTAGTILRIQVIDIKSRKAIKTASVTATGLSAYNKPPQTIQEARVTANNKPLYSHTRYIQDDNNYEIGASAQGLYTLDVSAKGYIKYTDTLLGGNTLGQRHFLTVGLKKK